MKETTLSKRVTWVFAVLAGLAVALVAVITLRPGTDETSTLEPGEAERQITEEPVKRFKVALTVLKDNMEYYTARQAFVNFLKTREDMVIEFMALDAFGDMKAYKRGLRKFVAEEVDLVFSTGTRSTLPVVEIVKDIPVVFTAVAAPVRSGIVKSFERPGGNVTGTHCTVPAYPQLKAIMRVLPDVRVIGIVYTGGEPNAEIQVRDFKDEAKKLGLEVLTSTVTKDCKTIEEVARAAEKLAGKVDVIAGLQDTSIARYGKGMINIASANNIPSYATLGQLLPEGALFSLATDFMDLGTISGEQAVKILKGDARAGDIPVTTCRNFSLIINISAAEKIGLKIPVQVLRTASEIIR